MDRSKSSTRAYGRGKPPVGYLNEPKLRTIVIDPNKAPLVKLAFELYATGKYPIVQIREMLNAKGMRSVNGIPLSPFRYQHILRNPFYYGVFRLNGEMHEGAHPPLITKELYDKVQEVMRSKSKANTVRLKSYVYRGLFKCAECGCGITMETQKGHNYLRCTKRVKKDCSQRFVREESMTEQVRGYLTAASLPDDLADWMIGTIQEERNGSNAVIAQANDKATRDIADIGSRRGRALKSTLEPIHQRSQRKHPTPAESCHSRGVLSCARGNRPA